VCPTARESSVDAVDFGRAARSLEIMQAPEWASLLTTALVAALLGTACASPAIPVTPAPAAPLPSAAPRESTTPVPAAPLIPGPFEIEGELRDEPDSVFLPLTPAPVALPRAPRLVPPAPATCRPFVERPPGTKPPCDTRPELLSALDAAIVINDVDTRDTALVSLEACGGAPAGLIRALRADLAPVACADAMIEPLLANRRVAMSGEIQHLLVGLAIAARQSRLRGGPPEMKPPFNRAHLRAYIDGTVHEWHRRRSAASDELTKVAQALVGYGRAVALLECGRSELRMWGKAATPAGPVARDDELRNAYWNELQSTTLLPTRWRAIELSTAGLAEYATLGVIADARRDRGSKLLTQQVPTRMATLAWTVLPPLPPVDTSTVEARLFARLPTFYAEALLPAESADDLVRLRAMVERGLGKAARARLRRLPLSPEAGRLVADAKVKLGLLYWRGVDFDQALTAIGEHRDDESLVLMAIALALRAPEDGRMRRLLGDGSASTEVRLRPLEWLTASEGPAFAIAAYDLAVIAEAAGADLHVRQGMERYHVGLGRMLASPFASLAKRRQYGGEKSMVEGIKPWGFVEPEEE
jgi:hypothetical protein